MCPHNPENRPDHTDSAGDADSNVVPLRRRPGRADVTVERIETEPMTAEEYRRAVITLAALSMNGYNRKRPRPTTKKPPKTRHITFPR
ncbi:hypothetical protein GCM10011581_05570 [Saccharopolyspora subtropica]|uniref:Uncharacterized protein n=1 Tax=Saccharopolyspora thermophila TaxID=89367 RepID=A0A917N8P3_9PSEU|nr:hypothetical protein GCM10011581_05570 [Saccharopolyspora subtropica]